MKLSLTRKMIVGLLVCGAWSGMTAAAQEAKEGWTLRLGASFRDFHDVKLDAVNFRNWGKETGAGPYGIQNSPAVVLPAPPTVPLDYIRWNGGDKGLGNGDGWAPVLGVGRDVMTKGAFRLGFVGNLQFYSLDVGVSDDGRMGAAGPAFSAYQVNHAYVAPPGVFLPSPVAVNPDTFTTATAGTDTRFWMRNRFSTDLLVLDAGFEAKADCARRLNLVLAGGPTLNLANIETRQDYSASWNSFFGKLPAGSLSDQRSEREFDAVAGLYGAIGVRVALNDQWSVAACLRYDYVATDVGTDQAELDLSGPSAQVTLIYAF